MEVWLSVLKLGMSCHAVDTQTEPLSGNHSSAQLHSAHLHSVAGCGVVQWRHLGEAVAGRDPSVMERWRVAGR